MTLITTIPVKKIRAYASGGVPLGSKAEVYKLFKKLKLKMAGPVIRVPAKTKKRNEFARLELQFGVYFCTK